MDKFESRRQDLIRLVERLGRGGIAHIARQIGKEPNYVSRLLYPSDKNGAKRIGEDTADLITGAFPGWNGGTNKVSEPSEIYSVSEWPFENITKAQWWAIPRTRRIDIEAQIMAVFTLHGKQTKIRA